MVEQGKEVEEASEELMQQRVMKLENMEFGRLCQASQPNDYALI